MLNVPTTASMYDSVLDNVTTSSTGFLSNCKYKKDFFHKTTLGADYQTSTGAEFKFNIFREIQPESLGTKHGTLGDFYIGTQSNMCALLFIHFIHPLNLFCDPPPTYVTKDSKIRN